MVSLWAVTQRQSDDMDFGKIRVFFDHDTALSAAWMEDGDSDMDLPLHDLEVARDETMSDAIRELWICGVWYEEDHSCIGLLRRAYRSLEAAQEAASSACSPADIGLSAGDRLGLLMEGLIDPDHLNLAIVHVTADGQPDGQLVGAFYDDEEDTDSEDDD